MLVPNHNLNKNLYCQAIQLLVQPQHHDLEEIKYIIQK